MFSDSLPGWDVGLVWKTLPVDLRGAAREAGLYALGSLWAATFCALRQLSLASACHRRLVVIATDRHVLLDEAVVCSNDKGIM
jgi:hypothetical protein